MPPRHGSIFRGALRFDFGDEDLRPRKLQPVGRNILSTGNLLARQLTGRDRVGTANAMRHVAIGDAFDFEYMKAAEVRNLLERQRGVFDEPDGRRFRHKRCVAHKSSPILEA